MEEILAHFASFLSKGKRSIKYERSKRINSILMTPWPGFGNLPSDAIARGGVFSIAELLSDTHVEHTGSDLLNHG